MTFLDSLNITTPPESPKMRGRILGQRSGDWMAGRTHKRLPGRKRSCVLVKGPTSGLAALTCPPTWLSVRPRTSGTAAPLD